MSFELTGVLGTSRKENEARLPIHPRHLRRIPPELRSYLVLEKGYGERFGTDKGQLEELGFRTAERREILGDLDIVVLPKITAEDLRERKEGSAVWGWPHCVQQRELTQVAIDLRLTLIAWEAMFRWGSMGERRMHIFYKNNELAGYCGVLHALDLLGWDGAYGPARRAVVLGFGSVGRGAVHALQGRGFRDIAIYTQRPPHLVRDQIPGCSFRRMSRPTAADGPLQVASRGDSTRPLLEVLAKADVLVNCTLQDTERPLDYLREGEEVHLEPGCLIVDVSCDKGMGFPFARPTSFDEPIFRVGDGRVTYYAVDHSPSYLWDAATWEISQAVLAYLETLMSGPAGWASDGTVERAIEIRDGVVVNPRILSFQERQEAYPHLPLAR